MPPYHVSAQTLQSLKIAYSGLACARSFIESAVSVMICYGVSFSEPFVCSDW